MMKSSEEIVNHYNYSRNTSFSRSLFYEINIMNFFNTGRIFNPEVLILSKKVWGPKRPAAVNFNIQREFSGIFYLTNIRFLEPS